MEYYIENEYLKLKFNSFGGELKEIINKKNGLSYLWDSNPKYWKRSSPILFPNVGKHYNNVYFVNGVSYKQSQHGFARDKEFKLLEHNSDYISFILESDEDTYLIYPFKFSLILSYKLIDNEIIVIWDVKNIDNKKMFFGIGGHPAFNVPLYNDKRSDYFLYFKDKKEIISSKVNLAGYVSLEKVVYKLDNGYLKISDDLFKDDALVLENQNIKEVAICDNNKNIVINMIMDVPLLGVWSPSSAAPFISIEPWWGRCDADGFIGDISEKTYENCLNCNETFHNEYKIVVGGKI